MMLSGWWRSASPAASTGSTLDVVSALACSICARKPGAQRVLLVDPPASVGLHAGRHVLPRRLLRDAVEQQVADRVGRETQRAGAVEHRDLHILVVDMLLQRQHGERGHLVLRFVQCGAVEAGHAVDVEAERRLLPGLLGIWKLPSKPPRIRLTRVSGSMMPDR